MENPIREYRLNNGLTQKELASLVGMTPQTILKVEQGRMQKLPAKLSAITKTSNERYVDWVLSERKSRGINWEPRQFIWPDVWPTLKRIFCEGNPSTAGVAKFLVMQDSLIQDFEKYDRNSAKLKEVCESVGVRFV